MNKGITNFRVKIYYLYNWSTDEVFYVGATKKENLDDVLRYHLSIASRSKYSKDTIQRKRNAYINQYANTISIEFVEDADYISANSRKCYRYHYFISQGFDLIQSKENFHYNKPHAVTTDDILDYERVPKEVHRVEVGEPERKSA